MAKKSLVIEILGNNKMGRAVRDAMGSLRKLGTFAKTIGHGIAKAFKWSAAGVVAAAGLITVAVKKAFDFEAYRVQLEVLLGSMEKATEAFKTLTDFSAKTPFQLDGIIEAYQQLQTFTDGALNAKEGLTLVGDAAAGRGKDFAEVAYWVGRLYSALKNGDPFMDAVGALQRLGVVGGTIRGDLTDLTTAGVEFGAKWAVVESQLLRFKGGMDKLSRTGKGLFSTMKDNWSLALATFGEAFTDMAKGSMTKAIETIQQLRDDGTIEKWAKASADAVQVLTDSVAGIFKGGEDRAKALDDLKAMFDSASGYIKPKFEEWGTAAGAAIWRGFKSAGKTAVNSYSTAVEEKTAGSWVRRIPTVAGVSAISAALGAIQGNGGSYIDRMQAGTSAAWSDFKRSYMRPGASQGTPLYVQEVKPIDGVKK